MSVFEELEEYILSHIDEEPRLLKKINREANVKLLRPKMLSGHWQGRLLKMLTQMIDPQKVLEIGTYTGYSALCIAEGLRNEARLHTIEIDDEMEDFIRNVFRQSELSKKIVLHIGDALKIIPRFPDNEFELAFIDADKRLYRQLFEQTLPKIKKGGFILADNTLWYGKVTGTPAANDRQTKGIIDFNDSLAADKRVEKVILPLRDGLTLIRKK